MTFIGNLDKRRESKLLVGHFYKNFFNFGDFRNLEVTLKAL